MSKEDEPETQEKADKDSPKNHDTFDVENQDFEGMEVEHVDGFAEIYPEDKHLIVELLQKKGYIVGMTGDGANVRVHVDDGVNDVVMILFVIRTLLRSNKPRSASLSAMLQTLQSPLQVQC